MSHLARVGVAVLCASLLPSCGGSGGGGGGDEEEPFLTLVDFQSASVVVGQAGPTAGGPNAGGGATVGAVGFSQPFGSVAGALFVTDTFNHRVLRYSGVPAADGVAAVAVLGQPDLATNVPGTTASKLNLPAEAIVSGGRLFVADFGNNRVLIWNSVPTSDTPADVVVGQPDFFTATAGTSQTTLSGPSGIAVTDGRLFVAEQENHRVLIWDTIPTTNGEPADRVIGHPTFLTNTPGASDFQLNTPTDVAVSGTRIFVSDTVNNRVLVWNSIPAFDGKIADIVLGQSDFVATTSGAGATKMFSPAGIHATSTQLFIADSANSRLLVYDALPTVVQQPCDKVLGQSTFANVVANDDDQDGVEDAGPTARTLKFASGVVVSGGRLFVTDTGNHRVLIFEGL